MLALLWQAATVANGTSIVPQGAEGWLAWLVRNAIPLGLFGAWLKWWVTRDIEKKYDSNRQAIEHLDEVIGLEKGKTVKGEINGLGERVDVITKAQEGTREAQRLLEGALTEQSKRGDRMHQDFGALRQLLQESITQAASTGDRLMAAIHEGNREAAERDSRVRERLAAVESKGDVGAAIERGFALQGEALKQLVFEMREDRRRRE